MAFVLLSRFNLLVIVEISGLSSGAASVFVSLRGLKAQCLLFDRRRRRFNETAASVKLTPVQTMASELEKRCVFRTSSRLRTSFGTFRK